MYVPYPRTYWYNGRLITDSKPIVQFDPANYHPGAVEMAPNVEVVGNSQAFQIFNKGVISLWLNSFPTVFDMYITRTHWPFTEIVVTVGPNSATLTLYDYKTGEQLVSASMDNSSVWGDGEWHHYVCSWDTSQLVDNPNYQPPVYSDFQFAVDGKTPNNSGAAGDGKYEVFTALSGGPGGVGFWSCPQAPTSAYTNLLTYQTQFPADGVQSVTGTSLGFSGTVFNSSWGDPVENYGIATFNCAGYQIFDLLNPPDMYLADHVVSAGISGTLGSANVRAYLYHPPGTNPQKVVKVQWARDRQVMSTDASDVGAQPMTSVSGSGNTGSMVLDVGDRWAIGAPADANVAIAYPYFGIADSFFDLTNPTNLNYFISPALGAMNLGTKASEVPLFNIWCHTGNANRSQSATALRFPEFCYNIINDRVWVTTAADGISGLLNFPAPPSA